jgi:hypothetical protein
MYDILVTLHKVVGFDEIMRLGMHTMTKCAGKRWYAKGQKYMHACYDV